jgi:hypothetical protein
MDTELREWLAVSLDGAAVRLAVVHVVFQLAVLSIAKQKSRRVVKLILCAESSKEINSKSLSLGVKANCFHEGQILWAVVA